MRGVAGRIGGGLGGRVERGDEHGWRLQRVVLGIRGRAGQGGDLNRLSLESERKYVGIFEGDRVSLQGSKPPSPPYGYHACTYLPPPLPNSP